MGMTCQLHRLSEVEAQRFLDGEPGAEDLDEAEGPGEVLSLEKAWHGLHFALTGSGFGAEGPLGFILEGGAPVEDLDGGYGPARVLPHAAVLQLANALDGISNDEFDRRFDLERLAEEQVYPFIWDEPRANLLEEYLDYFNQMKQFVHQAASQRQALMITLT